MYKKNGVEFYRNNNGIKGPGTCRNIGIKHSLGKWLIFADADDYFVEGMYDILEKHYMSDADVVYFSPDSIDEITSERSDRHLPYVELIENYLSIPNRKNELLLRFKVISPWSKMIRRAVVFENKVYFGTTIVAQDAVFITKLCYYAGKIEADKATIYCIIKRKDSLAITVDEEKQKIRTRIFIERCKYLKRRLSKEEYNMLNMNGTNRIIGMIAAGYSMTSVLDLIIKYALNGIKPIDMSLINPRTAVGTFFKLRYNNLRKKKE